jgi:hypothetical protein
VSNLPKPGLLHSTLIAMLYHLQTWSFDFLKTHKGLNKYNAIWLSVPANCDLTPQNLSYQEVTQWNWKEIKKTSRYMVGVVTQSLPDGSPTQHPIFNHAIELTQAWLEFYLYAQYKSHDNITLSCMEDTLHHFHRFIDIFLLR